MLEGICVCESGDRACGWCGSVGVLGVVCGVRMGVAVDCVVTREEGVASSGGSVDDGVTGWVLQVVR